MVLSDVFASPLGLAALLAAVPIIVLYLIRPDPRRLRLPTTRFLIDADGTSSSRPLLQRLQRNAVLLLQLLAVVPSATALATPYVPATQSETLEETVAVMIDDIAALARSLRAEHVVVDTGSDFLETFASVRRQDAARARVGRRR